MTKSILVTGCTGFIGSNFVKQFKKKYPNVEIIGISTGEHIRDDISLLPITLYKGSVTDTVLLEKIFSKHAPEYVFHLAGNARVGYALERPRESTDLHVVGTVALLEASKNHGVKRFIYASSVAVYGDSKKIPLKESQTPVVHKSPHALQKYTCEQFCKIFSDSLGLDTVCLRYFQIFGPGQYGYSSVISTWLESMYFPKAKKAFIEGDGSQSRDFCYIDNVVNANILAMKSKSNFNGDVINIASGSKIKLSDIRILIEKYAGKKLDLDERPARKGEAKDSCADITKAEELLGYTPKIQFEKGLKLTIAWFKQRTK